MTFTRPWLQPTDFFFFGWLFLSLLLVTFAQFRDVNAFSRTPKLAQLNKVCDTERSSP